MEKKKITLAMVIIFVIMSLMIIPNKVSAETRYTIIFWNSRI